MEDKLIVANLKMNLDINQISDYLEKIKDIDSDRVIICPSAIYIPFFLKKKYRVGIQNINFSSKESVMGEISATQAKKIGVSCAILGHSDCREKLNESSNLINKKIIDANNNGLNVILCVGETETERMMLNTIKVLENQISKALKGVENLDIVAIAYEPVWAIGNYNVATNKDIEEAVCFIKSFVKQKFNFDIKVLYGGSIDSNNVRKLKEIKELDGYLIGTAAANPEELLKIIEVTKN